MEANVGTDHAMMRELNRSLVLGLLRGSETLSRAEIARRTGLAKPTVSTIVEELIAEHLVLESGPGPSAVRGGRRPILVRYNSRARYFAGVRVGVRNTDLVVTDALGMELDRRSMTTPKGPAGTTLQTISDNLRTMLRGVSAVRRLEAIGVCLPGLVDTNAGVCALAPNLGWRDVAVGDLFEKRFGVPVTAVNTAQAALILEHEEGAARGVDTAVLLYVGRGLGAALLVGGELLLGRQGLAGEIGHCHVPGNTLACNCGQIGCLETMADGTAIARQAVDALARGRVSSLSGMAPDAIGAAEVAQAAAAGDRLAREIYRKVGETLGLAASWLINLTNPDLVLIGGGVAGAGPVLLDPVRDAAGRHSLAQSGRDVRIEAWTSSRRPGVTGAVRIAMRASDSGPRVVVA